MSGAMPVTTVDDNRAQGHSFLRFAKDLVITLLLWSYFTLGFIVFFSPFYLAACLLPFRRELIFQSLNHLFYQGFFVTTRFLMPGVRWQIDREVKKLDSCVIVCNHLSYLDPLVMISLFRRHKTVVKSTFFKTPIFGWVLRASGYIPSMPRGRLSNLMIRQTTKLEPYLKKRGILFVFPEGTRNRKAGISPLYSGAFKIARLCKAPVKVLVIRNTDKLFTPGRFLFNTGYTGTITVDIAGSIEPDYNRETVSASRLMEEASILLDSRSRG